jgi:hypothetical protein
MTETQVRIGIYLQQNGGLPETFDLLPVREGYLNRTTDAWGRPLNFQIEGDRFTLTSLGRDGVSGGTGDDADLIREYRVIDGEISEIR